MKHRGLTITLALIAAACGCLLAVRPARASMYIDVGTVKLLPDTPDQNVDIRVVSDAGDTVGGCNLNVEIGHGGSALGGTDGPTITAVDLATGTIFDGNNLGQTDLGSLDQLAMYSIVTDSGTVPADGLLARLTIDTTGYTRIGSTWTLALENTHNGPTDFAPVGAIITDGTIELVPEPATLFMIMAGGLPVMLKRRRNRS